MPTILYLAWGRPQRPRANLIQTLHTVAALTSIGVSTRLYLPPVPRDLDLPGFLAAMGVRGPIDLRGTWSLHRRWGGWPFAVLHRAELGRARAVYTRVPELSLVLARARVAHFLEVHETGRLHTEHKIGPLVAACRSGLIVGLVAISIAGRDALVEAGAPPGKVHVLPSGVDVDAFVSVPPLTIDDLAHPRALYAGRISYDRGLSLLEQIAAAGCPVHLVGLRDDDPRQAIADLRVSPPVAHAEVPALYAGAALALMPYQPELRHADSISPMKIFEAMAAGRLIIASDLPPLRELVTNGANGLLVAPDAPQAWLAAIDWVRNNPRAALAMAEAGRQRAVRFSWLARARGLCRLMGIAP